MICMYMYVLVFVGIFLWLCFIHFYCTNAYTWTLCCISQVTSWSVSKAAPDAGASDGSNPRSFLSVVSEMTHSADTCEGAADDEAGEARLDSELLLLLLLLLVVVMVVVVVVVAVVW